MMRDKLEPGWQSRRRHRNRSTTPKTRHGHSHNSRQSGSVITGNDTSASWSCMNSSICLKRDDLEFDRLKSLICRSLDALSVWLRVQAHLSQARIDRTMTRAVGLLAVTVVFEKTNLTRT